MRRLLTVVPTYRQQNTPLFVDFHPALLHPSAMIRTTILSLFLLAASAFAVESGYLFIETKPVPARFTVDNVDTIFFDTPILCRLAPGKHRIRLESPGYRPQTIQVVIAPEEVIRRSVSLDETFRPPSSEDGTAGFPDGTGKISVLSDRKSQVYVDGKLHDSPAPVTIAGVTPGLHEVVLTRDTISHTTRVVVQEGKSALVEVVFDEQASFQGVVRPRYRTRIFVTVELPPCRYKMESADNAGGGCRIRGVDPNIIIALPDSSVEIDRSVFLQHLEQVRATTTSHEMSFSDTTLVYSFEAPVEEGVAFTFRLRTNKSRGFRDLSSLKPTTKRFAVPARFNEGADITVHATVDESGDVIFRYW
jgi:PEGA domain